MNANSFRPFHARFGRCTVGLATTLFGLWVGATQALAQYGKMRIDGEFADWRADEAYLDDPAGDATGVMDIVGFGAAGRGGELFITLELAGAVNLQSGPEGEQGLVVHVLCEGAGHVSLDLRGRKVYLNDDPKQTIPWSQIGFVSMPTYASDRFELSVDLSALGGGFESRCHVATTGSDELAHPIMVSMVRPLELPERTAVARPGDAALRVASFNVYKNGLTDAQRADEVARLVRAVRADVYCFQELWDTSADDVVKAMDAAFADPVQSEGGRAPLAWNVHKVDGCVIATRLAMEPIESRFGRYALAKVMLPGGEPVLVSSVHLKCCGHSGSPEDLERIEQANGIAAHLGELTAGAPMPVVVAGDWNLVGSRTPLDVLEGEADGGTPRLERAHAAHLSGDDVYTWRSDDAGFPPALMDLVAFTPDRLELRSSFVFDSTELWLVEQEALGVQVNDSLASDHLMVVADFARVGPRAQPDEHAKPAE